MRSSFLQGILVGNQVFEYQIFKIYRTSIRQQLFMSLRSASGMEITAISEEVSVTQVLFFEPVPACLRYLWQNNHDSTKTDK